MINEPLVSSKSFNRKASYTLISIGKDEDFLKFLPLSWLKNKKKWKHNKRLRKRFCKRWQCYVPYWVVNDYKVYQACGEDSMYASGAKQIMEVEDEFIRELINQEVLKI